MNEFPFSDGKIDYAECRRVAANAIKDGSFKAGPPYMTDSQQRYFILKLRRREIE